MVFELIGGAFIRNHNAGGRIGFFVHDPSCAKIRMRSYAFLMNEYRLGLGFAADNVLEDITVKDNNQRRQLQMNNGFTKDDEPTGEPSIRSSWKHITNHETYEA